MYTGAAELRTQVEEKEQWRSIASPSKGTARPEAMSVADIWDFISGTDDSYPADEQLALAVLQESKARLGSRPLRILDLGGGAGNPSIALAARGHRVTLVDNDEALLSAAIRRSAQAMVQLDIVRADWREYLSVTSVIA